MAGRQVMAALSLVGVLADRAHHRVRTRWWAGKLKRHWALLERAAVSLNSWGAHIRGCSKVRKLISRHHGGSRSAQLITVVLCY
eukprot:1157694-Pelagomonas_calceolata.AAC.18